jgi:transcriptional regulator with XRE-family HTH domain
MYAMSTTPAAATAAENESEVRRSEVVAQRLRVALAALDLNVSAAARTLGWSQSNLQRMTKGQVKLSVDQLDWVQQRLGVPMTYLLGITDDLPGMRRRGFPRPLRPVSDPAEVLFNDGTGDQLATGSESFLSESNRRPFHYKGHGQVVQFPFRPRTAPKDCPATGRVAKVIPFPA